MQRGLETYVSAENTTCGPSMLSAEDSPAKTYPTPVCVPVLRESDQGSGVRCAELLANYDPSSCSWRTSQLCLDGEWAEFWETFPRSGMTRSGRLYPLLTLGRRTSENEFGSWPTPTVMDATLMAKTKKGQKGRHFVQLSHLANSGRIHLGLVMWPTPTSRDWKDGTAQSCQNVPVNGLLGRAVHWPTPSVCGNYNRKGASPTSGDGLATRAGGALNPTWVEWLMGYPEGWTALEDEAIPDFPRYRN